MIQYTSILDTSSNPFRIKGFRGQLVWVKATVHGQDMYLMAEVIDCKYVGTVLHCEISPLTSDRTCVWVDASELFIRETE